MLIVPILLQQTNLSLSTQIGETIMSLHMLSNSRECHIQHIQIVLHTMKRHIDGLSPPLIGHG